MAFSNVLRQHDPGPEVRPGARDRGAAARNGDVVVNGDRMDVTWKLKEGMKWSDGEPITCDDLEATWKWIMDPDNTGLAAGTTGWEDISRSRHGAGTDCVVHFSQDLRGLPRALHARSCRSTTSRRSPSRTRRRKLYPLGDAEQGVYSGPYIPTEIQSDAQITFAPTRTGSTIGGHAPYLDKVIFKYYGDAAAMIAGYRAGEIDVADGPQRHRHPVAVRHPAGRSRRSTTR